MNKIVTYCGKPIEEMSREELITALEYAVHEVSLAHQENARRIEFMLDNGAARENVVDWTGLFFVLAYLFTIGIVAFLSLAGF